RLDVALALAAVLAGARVTAARTAALPLAGVDAGAHHLVAARLLLGPRRDGAREEQRGGRAGDEHALGLRVHGSSPPLEWVAWCPLDAVARGTLHERAAAARSCPGGAAEAVRPGDDRFLGQRTDVVELPD